MNIFYLLYKIAAKLPASSSKVNFGQKRIRYFLASKFVKKVGANVNFEKNTIPPIELEIGNNSGIGINCVVQDHVVIGNDVMMGPEVLIFTTNHGHDCIDKPMNRQGHEEPRSVTIGNDVWIGQRSIILPGVVIPDGCIIGAGAVVTAKQYEAYSIIAGNPARIVGKRKE